MQQFALDGIKEVRKMAIGRRILARTYPHRCKPRPSVTRAVSSIAAWRIIGVRNIYFRSKMEANYGRYLEWLRSINEIEMWEHEPITFWFDEIKRGCVSYLPDFKVYTKNGSSEYHEVKGWFDPKSKTKIKRMAKYYPSIKLIVIGKKEYNSIARKVSCIVQGWE